MIEENAGENAGEKMSGTGESEREQNNGSDSSTEKGGKDRQVERMTYLFLIRHGENDWTKTGKLAGRTAGVHLNDRGREQAATLADSLAQQPISAVYSSPLIRCIETAQPLADRLGLPVQQAPGVLEVDYGAWRGGVLGELAKLPEWQLVQVYPGGFRFPGGETLREVQNRVVAALEAIRIQHIGEAVAVFAHGDILRTSLAYYLGVPLDLFQRIQISTASVSLIGFHRFGPRILLMNHTGAIGPVRWGEEKSAKSGSGQNGSNQTEQAEAEKAT